MNTLLLLTVSLLAGFLPMVCWAVILWWFDRFEKEPVSLLAVSFLWGVVPGISISLLMEFLLNPLLGSARAMQPLGFVLFRNDMLAPVIEEGVKLLGLVGVFLAARNEIDGPLDGMIYAAMIGFGFAAAENTLFFLTSRNIPDFLLLVFLRAVLFGSAHAMFAALSGLGLAMARYARRRWQAFGWMIGGFALAVAFHWLHNAGMLQATDNPLLLLLSIGTSLVGMLFVVMLLIGALLRERQSIRKFLLLYVQEGLMSEAQWKIATSIQARWSSEWAALKQMNMQEYHRVSRMCALCAELALKEKQRYLFGPDRSLDVQIQALRMNLFAERWNMEINPRNRLV